MTLYADENFPLAVVIGLRSLGHDVLTAFEDGRANRSIEDSRVLARAEKLKRALLTINRSDFRKLHNSGIKHSGIILCTFDPDFQRQALRIHETIENTELDGRIINVYRPSEKYLSKLKKW